MGMGYDVLNIGLATTPTTELAVTMSGCRRRYHHHSFHNRTPVECPQAPQRGVSS